MRTRTKPMATPALLSLILSILLLLRLGAAPAIAKGGARSIVISLDGTRLYVAHTLIRNSSATSAVAVVDTAKAAKLKDVAVGQSPWGVVIG